MFSMSDIFGGVESPNGPSFELIGTGAVGGQRNLAPVSRRRQSSLFA